MSDLTPTKGLAGVGKHFEWLNKNKRDYAKAFKTATKLAQKRHFWLINNCKKALLTNKKALLTKNLLCKISTNYLKRIKNKNALNGRAFCLWA